MTDLNMLKAITAEKNRGASLRWEAAHAVDRVLNILREHPEGNQMWKPLYEALAVSYGLIADWGDENPPENNFRYCGLGPCCLAGGHEGPCKQ
jgi:hypothetical protein